MGRNTNCKQHYEENYMSALPSLPEISHLQLVVFYLHIINSFSQDCTIFKLLNEVVILNRMSILHCIKAF